MKIELLNMQHVFSSAADVRPTYNLNHAEELSPEKYCAIKDFNLTLNQGEFLYISGARGSGKRELFNILSGRQAFQEGKITLGDKVFKGPCILPAAALGVHPIIPREKLPRGLTVAEYIFLMKRNAWLHGIYNRKTIVNATKQLMEDFNIPIGPKAKSDELTIAQQDMVKILNVYVNKAKLIALFEVVEQYTKAEKEKIFQILDKIKTENACSVIWFDRVIHQEIARKASMAMIMSGGYNVKVFYMDDTPREIQDRFFRRIEDGMRGEGRKWAPKENRMGKKIFHCSCSLAMETDLYSHIDFTVREGEIAGFYDSPNGVVTRYIEQSILGEAPERAGAAQGEIEFAGRPIKAKYYQNVRSGIRFVDGANIERHVVPTLTVADNLALPLRKKASYGMGVIRKDVMKFLYQTIDNRFGPGVQQ